MLYEINDNPRADADQAGTQEVTRKFTVAHVQHRVKADSLCVARNSILSIDANLFPWII